MMWWTHQMVRTSALYQWYLYCWDARWRFVSHLSSVCELIFHCCVKCVSIMAYRQPYTKVEFVLMVLRDRLCRIMPPNVFIHNISRSSKLLRWSGAYRCISTVGVQSRVQNMSIVTLIFDLWPPNSIEKKEEIWLGPMTKAPTPTEMSKGQSDNKNNATKSSITQRLRTDLGRSVGVTTATQLVWLT